VRRLVDGRVRNAMCQLRGGISQMRLGIKSRKGESRE
jgi:hypothetical protein